MRKLLVFVISTAMLVGGLYLLAFELLMAGMSTSDRPDWGMALIVGAIIAVPL